MKKELKEVTQAGVIGTGAGVATTGIISACLGGACSIGAAALGGPVSLGVGLVVGLGFYSTKKVLNKKKLKNNSTTSSIDNK